MRYFFDVHREMRIYQLSALLVTCSIVLVAFFYSPTAHAQSQSQLFITETNCPQIGVWNANTCTLTGDVDIPLIIQMPGITLDGNGYTITAAAGLNDATISLMGPGITVKNVAIRSTAQSAINILDTAPGAVVVNVIIHEPRQGVFIQAQDAVIRDVSVIGGDNTPFGLRVSRTSNISITGLSVVNGFFGINVFDSTDVEISKSRIENVQTGVAVEFSNGVVLEQSILSDIAEIGVNIGQQSEIIVRNNQIKGIVNPGAEREGVRLTEINSIDNTVITGNAISNWDVGINDRTFYDNGGPIQVGFLNMLEVIWQSLVPTAWAQVIGGISIYNNNFTLNTTAYDIPINAAGTVLLSQNQVGNYWDNYDQPAEGCVDNDTNQVCDNAFQNPGQIADEYPSTVEFAHQFEPVVSAVCSLYTADEVSAQQGITVRFTSAFADEIVPAEITGEIDYSTNTFQVTPTATGTQTVSAVVNGIGGSSECSTQVLVTGEVQPPEPTGASSVLFLPGIQASRLYKENVIGREDQLWTPTNLFSQDIRQLEMTVTGQSVNDIYTRDILDEAPGAGSVYATFVTHMEKLQRDGVIHEFKPFAYDWRFGVDTVVNRGVRYEQGVLDLVKVLRALAEDAPSGQVTIIGHSNGGLVTKALVQELENRGEENLVDQIIFIGTPHTGTPKAIATILHGYDQSVNLLGLPVVQASVAREVINNMPGAYGLLPTSAYFNGLDESIIQIVNTTSTKPLFDTYGSNIGSYQEFSSFMKGESDSLDRSLNQSISVPSTVNRLLFEQVDSLDDWVAPETITVTQIVGMGLWTPASILYREVIEEECTIVFGSGQRVCGTNALLRPFAQLSRDGDETVMGRSAQAYAGDSEIYYVDMENLNITKSNADEDLIRHYNLTEAEEIQNLVQATLLATTSSYSYISSTKPDFDELFDIEVIDSPVLMSATDSNGNTSGVVRENGTITIKTEIPNSQYFEFGGSKYLVLPSDMERTTTLVGEDFGGYTLTLATVGGDNVTEIQSVMSNASVTPAMRATFSKTNTGYGTIVTDIDGDGAVDLETSVSGEVVVVPNSASYDSLRSLAASFQLPTSKHRVIDRFIGRAERFSQNDDRRKQRINRFYLRLIDRTFAWYQRAGLISREDRQSAQAIIKELR